MEREEGGIGEEWKGRWKTMTDREEDSSRDGWMEDGGKVDFGILLCSTGINMNGSMLPPPTLHRDNTFSVVLLPQKRSYINFTSSCTPTSSGILM